MMANETTTMVEEVKVLKERFLRDLTLHSKVLDEVIFIGSLKKSYFLKGYTEEDIMVCLRELVKDGSIVVLVTAVENKYLTRIKISDSVYSYHEDEEVENECDAMIARYHNMEHTILFNLLLATIQNKIHKTNHKKLIATYGFDLIDLLDVLDYLEDEGFLTVSKKKKIQLTKEFVDSTELFAKSEFIRREKLNGLNNFLSRIREQVNN